jgi:hypothetical protein
MTHEALEPLLRAVSTQAGEEKLTARHFWLLQSVRDVLGLVLLNTCDLQFRVSEGAGQHRVAQG